jgi:hypothetical protein
MEQSQAEIARRKKKAKADLMDDKNDCLAVIFALLLLGVSRLAAKRRVSRMDIAEPIRSLGERAAMTVSRRNPEELMKGIDGYFQPMRDAALAEADRYEGDLKQRMIAEGMRKSRGRGDVFWICSKHDDCAPDHKAWQGRIYVDERWRSIAPAADRRKVEAFISKYNTRTVQWVEGAPVYLLTRPNCRHFMEPVSTKEALSSTAERILKRRGMHYAVGPRGDVQTFRTAGNAEAMLERYEDRLALHQRMASEAHTHLLDGIIRKDRILVDRWLRTVHNGGTNETR